MIHDTTRRIQRVWALSALLAISGCTSPTPAVTAEVRSPRMAGAVSASEWKGPWLPTLKTVSVPVADYLSPFKKRDERAWVASHEADYGAVRDGLDVRSRARLEAVRTLLKDDAIGEAAFVRLMVGEPVGREVFLSALAGMLDAPLAEGIDRAVLVGETIAEVAEPGRVTQGLKMTCESASVAIQLIRRDPTGYVKLVTALASPDGEATLADGETIRRVADWASGTDGWRSLPGRLVQPAFATYGNAPLPYSNTKDKNTQGQSGLDDPQLAKLASAVFGRPFVFLSPANSTAPERMAAYRRARAAGWDAPVWLNWSTGHVCLAEGEADGRVMIDNPYGAIHTMTSEAFESVLHSVYVPKSL